MHYSYDKLSEAEKEVANEILLYTKDLAMNYVQEHDQSLRENRTEARVTDVDLQSHFEDIFSSAKSALASRLRSRGYDAFMGKPVLADDEVLKALINAVIQEANSSFFRH